MLIILQAHLLEDTQKHENLVDDQVAAGRTAVFDALRSEIVEAVDMSVSRMRALGLLMHRAVVANQREEDARRRTLAEGMVIGGLVALGVAGAWKFWNRSR